MDPTPAPESDSTPAKPAAKTTRKRAPRKDAAAATAVKATRTSPARVRKSAGAQAAAPKSPSTTRRRKSAPAIAVPRADEFVHMIATAAYYLAEKRGFAPGHELEDWLSAEHQIRQLAGSHSAQP